MFFGTSRDPREGLWMIKISNICLHQNSISIKFFKILKIHEIFLKIRELFLFCFTMYTKRTCSQLEDGREAPSKASEYTFRQRDIVLINRGLKFCNLQKYNHICTTETFKSRLVRLLKI